jgi:hypothetical protein
MKLLFTALILASTLGLSGCASGPAAPAWEAHARNALDTTIQHYLTGNARAEEQDYARAYQALAATGRADLLAQAELTRCAARVASLVFDDCPAFKPLAADARPEQRAYAAYLAGRWQGLNAALLPKHHAAVLASPANPAVLLQIPDPLSRLVAAGAMLQQGALRSDALNEVATIAVTTASEQAWRRPLLAWLGLQAKQAETRGDTLQVAYLKRRIALILSMPGLKP